MTRVAIQPGLFEAIDDPSSVCLLGGRCDTCGRSHFPSQSDCPYCGGNSCRSVRLSRTGTLYLCTTVVSRPPGYDGPIPYGFGIVELSDDVRIISRIIDPDTARSGMPVELILEPVGTDEEGRELITYAFRPTSHQRPATSHR